MSLTGDRRLNKELYETIVEMTRSARLINDGLDSIANGKDYHSISIAGQIRALLSEKRKDAHSVLLYLGDLFKYELNIFFDDAVGFDGLPVEPDVHLLMGELSAFQSTKKQRQLTLESFYKQTVVAKYFGKPYTLEELVKIFANHSGGAHFSKYSPREMQPSPMLHANGYPLFLNFVLRFADVLVRIMHKFIRELFESELHIVIVLPNSPSVTFPICNLDCPGTPMELAVSVDNREKLHISLQGLDGVAITVGLNETLDLSHPTYLQVRIKVNESLSTEVEVCINGKEINYHVLPSLLLIYNEILHQSLHIGSWKNGLATEHDFKHGDFVWVAKRINTQERAKIVIGMTEIVSNEAYEYLLIDAGSYLHKAVGTYEMKVIGK